MLLHRLVANAFHGVCESGLEVSHLDGDKSNNRADNLIYETHRGNVRRRRDHGTEFIPTNAKITLDDARRAFTLRSEGKLQREIAEMLGLDQSTVSKLLAGKSWPQARTSCEVSPAKG